MDWYCNNKYQTSTLSALKWEQKMKYCMSIQYPNPNDWIQRLFCFCGVCWAVGNCQADFQIESGSSLWLLVPRSRTQWWVIVKMWAPIWDSPDWLTALYSCPIDTVPSYSTLSFINGPPPAPCNVLSLSSSSCLDWPAATLSPALSLSFAMDTFPWLTLGSRLFSKSF